MLKWILRIVSNAVALWAAVTLLPGMEVLADPALGRAVADVAGTAVEPAGAETISVVLAFGFVGLVFSLVNALIRPIVGFLSLPLTILTLGLFTIVINAGMLLLTSWLTSFTPVRFSVDSFFWTAILGSLIVSVVSLVLSTLTRSRN
ncbi:phage holin family protein [Arthrobacter sp. Br18]|uniref:phage holin family protein n=1 Tax=Arthrobacter sp. Br18 TaxID=1312954 RepID=UPI00047C2F8E|nr:phage holin family protein [Arthrobacter sp. Br18]